MSDYIIDFTSVSAKTPFDANNDADFSHRAGIALGFEANWRFPAEWLFGEMQGEDAVVNAIARLEVGGISAGWTRRDPFPWASATEERVSVDNIQAVNDVLQRTRVRAKVGTSFNELSGLVRRTGEWDTVLKGLVIILYRHERKLRPSVYAHVLHDLMNQRGARPAGADLVDNLPILETENHVLMIESSRYLTNQLLFLEWQRAGKPVLDLDPAMEWNNTANGMNEWMLRHLRQFLQHDFWEYNSRPYQRYSMAALQNLYDFAWDERVKCAARVVLDYVSAKTAVSSNGLRRAVPFRRLKDNRDKTQLFGDPVEAQTSRFLMLSGLTSRLSDVGGKAHALSSDQLVLAALTSYRVPEMILDILMDKGHNSYYQQFHHGDRSNAGTANFPNADHPDIPGGIEIYASSREALLSAGGVWLRSGNLDLDEWREYADNGYALPSTLMPSRFGPDRSDFIRIDGSLDVQGQINTGLLPGFAFGLNVNIPPSFLIREPSLSPASDLFFRRSLPMDMGFVREGNWNFIDASPSSHNWHRGLGLYVAVYIENCQTLLCALAHRRPKLALIGSLASANFGFFEYVSSDRMDFNTFRQVVLEKNGSRTFTSEGVNEYETVDGRRIQFTPNPSADKYQWGVLSVNGQPTETNIHNWPLVRGDIMNSDGHAGRVTVDNPYLKQRLVLDMLDPMIPRRYHYRTDAPRHTAGALVSRDIYRLDAFWVAPNGAIESTNWDAYVNGGTWAEPVRASAPHQARWNSPVVSVSRTSEHMDLFWIGPDAAICTNWRNVDANRGEWNRSFVIPRTARASESSGLAALARTHDHLDVFWIAPDGAVMTQWWNAAAGFGWDQHDSFHISGEHPARRDSKLSAIARQEDHIDVFWIAADGSVWTAWWDVAFDQGRWQQPFWIAPPGSARTDSGLTAVAKTREHIDVFWIAPDGAIWTHWWNGSVLSGQWNQHAPYAVTPGEAAGAGSGLAAVARFPTKVDLFWITPHGAIGSTFFDDAARSWALPWFEITPQRVAQTYSSLSVVSREPDCLDLVWIGPDNALWAQWWDSRRSDGSWMLHPVQPITAAETVQQPMWTFPRNESRRALARSRIHLDVFWTAPTPARGIEQSAWVGATALARWSMPGATTPGTEWAHSPGHSSIAAVARTPADMNIFWMTNIKGIATSDWNLRANNDSWSGHTLIAEISAARADSSVAAVSRAPGAVDVFWIAPDGRIATSARNDDGRWAEVSEIASGPIARRASPLAVLAPLPERLTLFCIGRNGMPCLTRKEFIPGQSTAWEQTESIPGGKVARPDSSLAAVARLPENLDVFWVGTDNAVWTTWRDAHHPPTLPGTRRPRNTFWRQGRSISGQQGVGINGGLAAFSRQSHRIEVFWVGADGTIWRNGWDAHAPDTWGEPAAISGPAAARQDTPLSVTARLAYGLDVFWTGTDGAIWTNRFDERWDSGNWHTPMRVTPLAVA